jgi:NarL family two-component system response regulator LiaR
MWVGYSKRKCRGRSQRVKETKARIAAKAAEEIGKKRKMPKRQPISKPVNGNGSKDLPMSGDHQKRRADEPRIRILVADDHAVIRLGIVALLETRPGFEVVGEAASGLECCKKAAALKPDVVILDLEMGDCGGVQAIERLSEAAPDARVVVFTAHVNDCLVSDVIGTGALGYVPKTASSRHLVDAVRTVHGGGAYLDPSISSLVMGRLSHRGPRPNQADLSARESSVLRLLAEGKRNKEIADSLLISERTVKFHVSALMQKLDASNRTEAVTKAIVQGLVRG